MGKDLMIVPNTHRPTGLAAAIDRLDSWKEIATYLRREVRTVQLWEKKEGLPVHRHFHKHLGSVFAFRSEIDSWARKASGLSDWHHKEPPKPTSSAPGTSDRIAIQILPLKVGATPSMRRLGDAIAAKTVSALRGLSPSKLEISEPCGNGLDLNSAAAKKEKPGQYFMRWSLQPHSGDTVQMSASLLHGDSEVITWSHVCQCYPREDHELAAYVADQIVQCFWLKLVSAPVPSRPPKFREQPSSREAYLKGRYFWKQRHEASLRKAIQCFESAIQNDPQFALPYSGLADSLILLSFYEIVPPAEIMPIARRAALKAVELDPELAEAHTSLGDVLFHFDRDWQGADREYRRAIQCNPDYALGYQWYANLLAAKGNHEAAHIAISRALEIDPVSPSTVVRAGVTAHLAHRFDEAIKSYQSALELDPRFTWAHMYMAQALEQKGDFDGALREFEITLELAAGGSNCVKAMMAHAHAVAGDKASARHILRELRSAARNKCMPSYDIAAAYAALGDAHQTVIWLNRACQERNMKLFSITQDPRFDPLRHRSDFKEILDQVGLGRYSQAHRPAVGQTP